MNMLHNAWFVSLWEVNQDCRRVISYYSLKWNKTSRSLSCIVNQYINLSVTLFKAREENLCMLVQGDTLAGIVCPRRNIKQYYPFHILNQCNECSGLSETRALHPFVNSWTKAAQHFHWWIIYCGSQSCKRVKPRLHVTFSIDQAEPFGSKLINRTQQPLFCSVLDVRDASPEGSWSGCSI